MSIDTDGIPTETEQRLMDCIGDLLKRIDDLLTPSNGELSIHSYGQTPDWFVDAAFLSAYGKPTKKLA